MKLDAIITPSGDLRHDVEQIKQAEQLGFDAAWVPETAHNPFFSLTIAAKETSKIQLGTRIALAFPRSPMVTAQIAWDLARQTNGRFILGLGSQIGTHMERRFSEAWGDPGDRMREYIESLRAIWNSFQTDARLRYRGKYFQFRLMAPFFNPGPISNPAIPIYLAGINPRMCELAGQTCRGLHAHAFHSPSYLREVIIPAIDSGLRKENRARSDFALTVPAMIVNGNCYEKMRQSETELKKRLANFASRSSFRRALRHHGWERPAEELSQIAREKRWGDVMNVIGDDMLREFVIIAEPGDVYASIIERYDGLADRVCLEWNADSLELYEAIAASRNSM
jgi:probable F420-dependent oxidoreductase